MGSYMYVYAIVYVYASIIVHEVPMNHTNLGFLYKRDCAGYNCMLIFGYRNADAYIYNR